jgi:hypothetical protein
MMRTGVRAILLTTLLIIIYAPLRNDPLVGSASASGDPVITINGDDDLTAENGVSSGSGTEEDPYIIEDKNITMVSNGTINIRDTDKFVTIRNCSLHSDRDDSDAIINLFSASNVSIVNCTIYGYRLGVRMDKCEHIAIQDVLFENGLLSIHVFLSSNVSIENAFDIPDKNDRSVLSEGAERLSIQGCSLNGSIDLYDSIYISIVDTTFKQGLSIWGEMTGIYIDNVTLDGKEILFVKDEDDVSISGNYGAVFLVNVTDSIFPDQNIPVRIFCSNCDNFTFDNCTLMTILMMWDCSNISFKNNILSSSYFYLTRSNINSIMGCNLTDSRIFHTECANISVENNTFTMNSMIQFTDCQNILYSKNDNTGVTNALGWVTELSFDDCMNIEYSNNSIGSYKYVWITSCNGMDIKNSIFMYSTRIFISGVNNLSFHDSTLSHVNIQLSCNGSVELFRNYIHNVGFDSYFPYFPSNVFVYNNIIDGSIVSNNPSEINWSYMIRGVRNIVGGPSIGGNFWVGYAGKDTNFDGFGDEYLPQGPGDNLPLIDLRGNLSLQDLTAGVPITGRDFAITFKAWEPIVTLSDLYYVIDYSFYDLYGEEFYERSTAGYLMKNHERSYDIRIKNEAVRLDYVITVSDRYGRAISENGSIPVVDGTYPKINLINTSNFETGKEAFFRFSVTDNIRIDSFNLTMLVNDEKNIVKLDELTEEDQTYLANFTVDPTAYRLKFIINATDVNGFLTRSEYGWYPVEDVIDPYAYFLSSTKASRGENYTIRFTADDNIGLSYIALYQIIGDHRLSIPWLIDQMGYYSTIKIHEFQPGSTFLLYLKDEEGNEVEEEFELQLGPMERWITVDPGSPMTGEIDTITIDLDPDIEVDGIRYRFDEGAPINDTFDPEMMIKVPNDARSMTLGIDLRDGGGFKYHYETTCAVLDIIPPSITVDASDPLCGEQFSFRPIYIDNIAVSSHGIVFDHGTGPIERIDDENFLTAIDIPIDALILNISIWTKDLQGNTAYKNLSLDVIDGILPVINSIDAEIVYDRIRIIASISDNRGPDDLECKVESDSMPISLSMDLVNGIFEAWIDPPEGVDHLYFTVIAIDGGGNIVRSDVQGIDVPIEDIEEPPDKEEGIPSIIKIALIAFAIVLLGSILISLIRKSKRSPEE